MTGFTRVRTKITDKYLIKRYPPEISPKDRSLPRKIGEFVGGFHPCFLRGSPLVAVFLVFLLKILPDTLTRMLSSCARSEGIVTVYQLSGSPLVGGVSSNYNPTRCGLMRSLFLLSSQGNLPVLLVSN